jgi:hypothetical protein
MRNALLVPLMLGALALAAGCGDKADDDDDDDDDSSEVSCVDTCQDLGGVLAEVTAPEPFDIDQHNDGCATLGDGSCGSCWARIGDYLNEEYRVLPDCYCIAPESERDPAVEELLGTCEEMVDEYYNGAFAELLEQCSCAD